MPTYLLSRSQLFGTKTGERTARRQEKTGRRWWEETARKPWEKTTKKKIAETESSSKFVKLIVTLRASHNNPFCCLSANIFNWMILVNSSVFKTIFTKRRTPAALPPTKKELLWAFFFSTEESIALYQSVMLTMIAIRITYFANSVASPPSSLRRDEDRPTPHCAMILPCSTQRAHFSKTSNAIQKFASAWAQRRRATSARVCAFWFLVPVVILFSGSLFWVERRAEEGGEDSNSFSTHHDGGHDGDVDDDVDDDENKS